MLNLRARQYEPAVMRFGQRDIWHGKVEMPTSQNRYLYCVNDPIGYYDRSGNRVDEDAGKPKKVTPSTNVKTAVPFSEDTAQSLRQEQFAIRKINSANRQLDTALRNAGVDPNSSSEATQQVVAKARQEIAQKAANGTLTASERDKIIQNACGSTAHASHVTIADLLREFIESGFSVFKDHLEFREEIEPIENDEFSNFSLGSFELSRVYTTITAGSYQNLRKMDSPDTNFVFLSTTKGVGVGSSFYYKNYFSSLVAVNQSLSIEVGYKDNSYGLTISTAGDKVTVSFDSTIYNDDNYVRTSTIVSTSKLLLMAEMAGIIVVGCAPEIALPALEISAFGELIEAASKLIPAISSTPVH